MGDILQADVQQDIDRVGYVEWAHVHRQIWQDDFTEMRRRHGIKDMDWTVHMSHTHAHAHVDRHVYGNLIMFTDICADCVHRNLY